MMEIERVEIGGERGVCDGVQNAVIGSEVE